MKISISIFLFIVFSSISIDTCSRENSVGADKPNIILIMADDLGYGDTGFTGNTIIKTPNLDQMAKDGAIMTNFHSGSAVCSPTRGSLLTGRHSHRYGIFYANVGHLPKEEITLGEVLKKTGYLTGHFGKWHLGTLSKEFSSKGSKRKIVENYSPPAWHGYDTSFVTESAVQLWDPTKGKRAINNPFFLDGIALEPNRPELQGGASRVVMDQALPFIQKAVERKQPFFTVIWFHAPHMDVVAGPKYLAQYKEYGEAAHYYGVISEMDEQIGRLRENLKRLGVAQNTLISFTSDNGPEGKNAQGRTAGVTKGLKGRKRELYEGGVRVPTVAVWPNKIAAGSVINTLSSTLDYLPTINEIIGYQMPDNRPIDGQSILPALLNLEKSNTSAKPHFERTKPVPFYIQDRLSLIEGDFKLVTSVTNNEQVELYNLKNDLGEKIDVSAEHPIKVKSMSEQLKLFLASAESSHRGDDYKVKNFKPVDSWPQTN